jgi:hypothetical protein
MEQQILDAEEPIIKKRPPVSTWKTGLLMGVVAVAFFVIGNSGIVNFRFPSILPMLLFGWIAQVGIAALGKRKDHFMRIWISAFPAVIFVMVVDGLLVWLVLDKTLTPYEYGKVIGEGISLCVGFMITAIVFWLFPGKLSYFRSRIGA